MICPVCGKEFEYGVKHRKFCSKRCRIKADVMYNREYMRNYYHKTHPGAKWQKKFEERKEDEYAQEDNWDECCDTDVQTTINLVWHLLQEQHDHLANHVRELDDMVYALRKTRQVYEVFEETKPEQVPLGKSSRHNVWKGFR